MDEKSLLKKIAETIDPLKKLVMQTDNSNEQSYDLNIDLNHDKKRKRYHTSTPNEYIIKKKKKLHNNDDWRSFPPIARHNMHLLLFGNKDEIDHGFGVTLDERNQYVMGRCTFDISHEGDILIDKKRYIVPSQRVIAGSGFMRVTGESEKKKQLVQELHVPARRNFPRRKVIIRGFDDLWQADLVDMRYYVDTGHHYILTVIDTLSKYGWAVALKAKSGKEVTTAMGKILKSGRCPKNLQTDNGKEFYNNEFQLLMKKRGINHYSTYSTLKASIVERWNRTLKTEMWKRFTLDGSYKWRNILQQLVDDYNARRHRTIGMRPVDVKPEHAEHLLATVYSNIKIVGRTKFKAGDFVRISKYKNAFAKGYTPNWTTEIFQITKVQRTNPATYLLRDSRGTDIHGGFYEYELLKTANPDVYLVEKILRKKGNKVFVKWLGMDKTHNSWINKNNVL
ncbi:uncharacterized protein [Prorops nasuta]|uniref:uncharacterized protein n=1 Tax=Prorops nasuta TaxID=863751 RepID=UPI0034CEDC5A